jgi:glycosyltransferase involved in cell wall biosynthesis
MAPKISVVIAVYNKASFLRQCIESVQQQTLGDFELICVDAGSTDGGLEILKEFAAKDPRIRVYSTPYTEIPAVTKNYGIDRTNGEYIFNLDADDYLSSDALENMYRRAKETGADAVVPDLQDVSEEGVDLPSKRVGLNGNRDVVLTGREAVTESIDWAIHAFALWNGNLIHKLRLEEFGVYSDEYSARLLFFNCNTVALSSGCYYHRITTTSITGKINPKMYDRPLAIYRLTQFLEENQFEPKHVCSLHFSVFKDCCYLIHNAKYLAAQERLVAEEKLKSVFESLDKRKVRKSVFARPPGRAAIWKVDGKVKKYFFAALSFLDWTAIKGISQRVFVW